MSVIIRLQNLPWTASAMDIRNYFMGLNIPDGGVHIVGGDKGDAFIAFATDEDARRAMLQDGGKVKDNYVKLFLSSKTEMQNVIADARRPSQQELGLPRHDPYQAMNLNPMPSQVMPEMPRMPLFPSGMPVVGGVALLPSPPTMRGGLLDRPVDGLPGHPERFMNAGAMDDGLRRPGPNGDAIGMPSRPYADGRPSMMNEGRDNRDFGLAERQLDRDRFGRNRERERRSRSRSPRHRSRSSRTREVSRERSRGRSRDRKRPDRGSPRDREMDRVRPDSRRDRERHKDDRKDNGRSSPRRKSPPTRRPHFEGPTRCIHVEFMPNSATYKDVRRFFRGLEIPRDGLRLKFEPEGRRQRHCYVKFFKPESAMGAMKMDGEIMEGSKVRITLIAEEEFETVVDDFSPPSHADPARPPPREDHGPEIGMSPPSLGPGSGNDEPGRGPPGLERRGPPMDRRGPPPDGRGPPPERRGPPGPDGRGPPPERRGPPGLDGRGPPPDRRRPPGPEGRGPPGPERRGSHSLERRPPMGGPDGRGPDGRGPDGRGPPTERPMDIPTGRPGMPPRDQDGPRRDFAPHRIPPGGPPGPGHADQSDIAIGYCAAVRNLPPDISRSDLRDFFGDQKLVKGGLSVTTDANNMCRGNAYFNFLREIDLEMALKKNGQLFNGRRIEIRPISREEFDAQKGPGGVPRHGDRPAPYRNGMERGDPEHRRESLNDGPPRRGLLPHPGRGPSPPPQREYLGSEPPTRGFGAKSGPLCVRLHGLNFNSTVETVLDFLRGIPIKPEQVKLLYRTTGEASGVAFVEFTNPVDHARTLERDKNFIGKRYINVTNISKEEAQREIEKFHAGVSTGPPRRGPPGKPAPSGGGGPPGRSVPQNTIFLSNLPYSVSPEEVLDFLHGFGAIPDSLRFREEGGKRTGEAMIVLSHPGAVDKAVSELQGQAVRGRIVSITT